MRNATPIIEVKPRRVGGATYQVPVEIRGDRRMSLGVRWLVQAARKRNGKSMSEKLAAEFVDAMNGLGAAVKRREDTHKMAEANRPSAISSGRPGKVRTPWHDRFRSHERGTSESSRTSTPARRPSPSGSFSIRRRSTRSARSTRAQPRWTGCPRSRSAGSPSPPLRRRRSGAIIASTSSIRPGTWTSRSRSSGACACSTARSSSSTAWPASSRSPRRSGARPTATACRASASSTSSTAPAPTSGAASTRSRTAWAPTPCRSRSRSAARTRSRASSTWSR